jgi:hypothetical protein
MTTAISGSTLLVSVGRGDLDAFDRPTDNKANVYTPVGSPHAYTNWQSSGTALYTAVGATGGGGHVVSNTTPPEDEITLAVVEVTGGSRIQDVSWKEVLAG